MGAKGGAGGSAGAGTIGGAGGTGGSGKASGSGGHSGGAPDPGTGTQDSIRWVGRVDSSNPAAAKFAWQGAGFVANVTGPAIAVKLRTEGTDTVFFQPVVDGTAGDRFEVQKGSDVTVSLASGLANGSHRVELYRETEGMYGVSTFLGFASGTVTGAPLGTGRLIEVVGDSISAGYGNLGSEVHPNWVADPACHWTAANSSWYKSYAALAGRAVGAEVSTIAHSGWGMVRDRDDSAANVLSSLYGNTLGIDATSRWNFAPKASAVVINLGTNDWASGDPGKPYETAYTAFIATVRAQYPDAWIFPTIGSMLGAAELAEANQRLAAVVADRVKAGDKKIATFDLGTQNMGADGSVPTGCDWHPNVADHQRMAGILETQLRSKLGW